MRHFRISLVMPVIPCLLLAVLFAACSSDNPVNPQEGLSSVDKGGLPVPDDIDPDQPEWQVDPMYLRDVNHDFESLDWEEVLFDVDLKGDYSEQTPDSWNNQMKISLTVSTVNADILNLPGPQMHTITFYVPRSSESEGFASISGDCNLYKISGFPDIPGVRVEMGLPMPGHSHLRFAYMYWLDVYGNYTNPEIFFPTDVDDLYLEAPLEMKTASPARDDGDIQRLVLDPLKPGEDR